MRSQEKASLKKKKMTFKLRAKGYVGFSQVKYERKSIPGREKSLAYPRRRLRMPVVLTGLRKRIAEVSQRGFGGRIL